jgi:hypothetical protein
MDKWTTDEDSTLKGAVEKYNGEDFRAGFGSNKTQ